MEDRPRMAGPFVPVPGEVIGILGSLGRGYVGAYVMILNACFVEEEHSAEGEWVTGTIRETRMRIAERTGIRRQTLNQMILPAMEGAGVMKLEGRRVITLPMLYKKSDTYLSIGQIMAKLNALNEKVEAIAEQNGAGADQGELPLKMPDGSAALPGSMPWIENKIEALWPGRGVKHPDDDEYVNQLAHYLAPALEEAFEAAGKLADTGEALSYGTYTWLLNRLRNPGYYRDGAKGKPRRVAEDDDDALIGRLNWEDEAEPAEIGGSSGTHNGA